MSGGPRLVLAIPDPRVRLRLVAALGARAELHPLASGEDPVRSCRSLRPELLLLAVPATRPAEALATSRAIKTEPGAAPRVVLVDPERHTRHPQAALESALADGYLGLELDEAALWAFLDEVRQGKRPVRAGEPPKRGLLARLWRS